jgi:hypothetical protein
MICVGNHQLQDYSVAGQTRQDLEEMAVDFRADVMELVNAGQYEHNLTLSVLKSYLLAGGTYRQ